MNSNINFHNGDNYKTSFQRYVLNDKKMRYVAWFLRFSHIQIFV